MMETLVPPQQNPLPKTAIDLATATQHLGHLTAAVKDRSLLCTPALGVPQAGGCLSPRTQPCLWAFAHMVSCAWTKKRNYLWAPLSDKQCVRSLSLFSVTLTTDL